MAEFQITLEEEAGGGTYRAWDAAGRFAGCLTYTRSSEQEWCIDHTKVEADFGGQGVGQQLIEEVLWEARQNKIKLYPSCSFVRRYFDKQGDKVADVRAVR